MTNYYVGQPVLSVMSVGDTYVQSLGPDKGKPVVRGIVTEVWSGGDLSVWWENTKMAHFTKAKEVKPEREPEPEPEYYVGQPVLNVSSGYVQERGPDKAEPVVRGIVTELRDNGWMSVYWDYTSRAHTVHKDGVKPIDN